MPYPRIQKLRPFQGDGQPNQWNSFQTEQFEATFLPGVNLVISETAVRSGKTGANAGFHRYMARANPGVRGIWLVESYKWYERVARVACDELFGHEASWHGTQHVWTWHCFGGSSVIICTYQDLQSMQGITAGWGSIDEYQNINIDAYNELRQRVSDRRVTNPVIYITGLPVFNSWAKQLAEQRNAVTLEEAKKTAIRGPQGQIVKSLHSAIHFENIGTNVNKDNILTSFTSDMRDDLDDEEYARRIEGKRPYPTGLVFKRWSEKLWSPNPGQGGNIIQADYNPLLPVSLDIDFGFRRSAALACNYDKDKDLDIYFDEHNLDDLATKDLCEQLVEIYGPRGDRNRRRLDIICCDPAGASPDTATGMTDIRLLREYFPWVEIKYSYRAEHRKIANGIKAMSARVCNAAGKRRWLMTKKMWDSGLLDRRTGPGYKDLKKGRSLALSITRMIFPQDKAGRDQAEVPVDCPIDGHCMDAARYGLINRHGVKEAQIVTTR